MGGYSSSEDIQRFLNQIGSNPLFVPDLDGNVMDGFVLNGASPFKAADLENPQNQNIPFGTPLALLDSFVVAGRFKKAVFAEKSMDARLPSALVRFINDSLECGEFFRVAPLTSRGADDARKLMVESGIEHIDRFTHVADSGATLYIGGEKTEVRRLSDVEKEHLKEIETVAGELDRTLAARFGNDLPKLYVEHKGIATNIHYREVLTALGEQENSDIDKEISALIKDKLEEHVAAGPVEADGAKTFKTLDAPAAVEMKIASVNKGHGLAAIIEGALHAGARPSAIVFSGDDVSKGNGTPGTDWFAMDRAKALAAQYGIPVYNIHTHHPVGNDLSVSQPDPDKSPSTLSGKFPRPPIDITVKSPQEMVSIILKAYTKTPERAPGYEPTNP